MISLVNRYLSIHIFNAVLFSELVLVTLAAIIKWFEQLKYLGVGQFDLKTLAFYVVYAMPKESVLLFPMAALIGGLLGLGRLASTSELIMMQVIGHAKLVLIGIVLQVILPLVLLHMVIDEYIAPGFKQQGDQIRAAALSGGKMTFSAAGVWAKSTNEYIHIDQIKQDGRLIGVTIYQLSANGTLASIDTAASAVYQHQTWYLYQTTTRQFQSDFIIETTKQAQKTWQTNLTPAQLGVVAIDADELSISGLQEYSVYLQDNGQNASRYQLEFWRKLMMPVSIIAMLLFACSFVFTSTRHITAGTQLLIGILVGFSFYVANQLLGSLSLIYGISPLLSSLLPSLMLITIALFKLKAKSWSFRFR